MATLGSAALTVGSLYKWQATLTRDSATWDLSAATVTFWWKKPDGSKVSQTVDTATAGGVCTYSDVASQLDQIGPWTFSAFVNGYGYVLATSFNVVYSP